MEKTKPSQQEESKTGPLPQAMGLPLVNTQPEIDGIPKTGPKAYKYDDCSTVDLIGKGGFGYVFRAIRNYD
jgi:hypothetical protein